MNEIQSQRSLIKTIRNSREEIPWKLVSTSVCLMTSKLKKKEDQFSKLQMVLTLQSTAYSIICYTPFLKSLFFRMRFNPPKIHISQIIGKEQHPVLAVSIAICQCLSEMI